MTEIEELRARVAALEIKVKADARQRIDHVRNFLEINHLAQMAKLNDLEHELLGDQVHNESNVSEQVENGDPDE